jgi:bifunctional non-homologous end joining protein LigD
MAPARGALGPSWKRAGLGETRHASLICVLGNRSYRSSLGCTHLYGVISCRCVSLIICTGEAHSVPSGTTGILTPPPASRSAYRAASDRIERQARSGLAAIALDLKPAVPAADGTTDFSELQNELKGTSTKIVMVAFDLMYLNGYDLRNLPLVERKALLKKLVTGTAIQFSESFEIDGQEIFKHACKTGLDGVVSKVRDSKYPAGRSNDWVKKTCAQRETLTIAGFALDGSRWDGLYLARRKGDDLVYAGKVDHGFDNDIAKDLQARLKPLVRKTQPYSKRIAHQGIWVEPSLLAEIEYRAKSAEGKVRHPVFKGLREDL